MTGDMLEKTQALDESHVAWRSTACAVSSSIFVYILSNLLAAWFVLVLFGNV